jgi:hypothetical protein
MSVTAPLKVCIGSSAGIDPAYVLHKGLQPRSGRFAVSGIPQCARPFADCLDIDFIVARAANNHCEWIGVLVEWKIGKFKGMPQKLLGPSPYFVMLDDFKHRL